MDLFFCFKFALKLKDMKEKHLKLIQELKDSLTRDHSIDFKDYAEMRWKLDEIKAML